MREKRQLATSQRLVAMLIGAGLAVSASACSTSAGTDDTNAEPVVVKTPEGSDLALVTLTRQAMTRTGVRTTEVRALSGARTAVPYSAVLYDSNGQPWVYTMAEPRTFVRNAISVVSIKGNVAVLSDGPLPGSLVASVGAAELYGSELGVDH